LFSEITDFNLLLSQMVVDTLISASLSKISFTATIIECGFVLEGYVFAETSKILHFFAGSVVKSKFARSLLNSLLKNRHTIKSATCTDVIACLCLCHRLLLSHFLVFIL